MLDTAPPWDLIHPPSAKSFDEWLLSKSKERQTKYPSIKARLEDVINWVSVAAYWLAFKSSALHPPEEVVPQ
jgi:hypothetical protein